MEQLEPFVSEFGSHFYGLPLNPGTVQLIREPHEVPSSLPYGEGSVIPLCGGTTLSQQTAFRILHHSTHDG